MTRGADPSDRIRRRRSDLLWLAGSLAILALCCAAIDGDRVSAAELRIFRAINALPGALYPAWWLLMQYGTFITIPAATVVALLLRRIRLAIEMAAAGVGVYLVAKVVKEIFARGRPGAILAGVDLRGIGAGGLGFPSGHAAVSAALAFILFAYLPRGVRWIPVALGLMVSAGRVYVGAHLPIDVLGGACLGIAAGALATFAGGVPQRERRREAAAAGAPAAGTAGG
jgi:membrane-associated phospholipid phosphatase